MLNVASTGMLRPTMLALVVNLKFLIAPEQETRVCGTK